ncbi:MAG: carotenoid biosynthesis protein [Egibacteraceae bacterium]
MSAPAAFAARPTVTGRLARALPVGLAAAVVALHVVYPLVEGTARNRLTVVTVVVFFTASITHAVVWRGRGWTAALVAVTAGGGFAVEALGVSTGWPFGAYAYTGTLGPQPAGVPLVIPLAWTMMAYPALVVGRTIATHRWAGPLVAGWALASWDLFLDPQMVDAGHWVWAADGPTILGIPLSNFAGWTLVAVAMMAVLWRVPARGAPRPDDRPLYALYLWVYASSVLAHLAFFGLAGSALLGGVGMGAIVVALLWSLRRR